MKWELSDSAILSDKLLTDTNDNLYNILCNTVGYSEDTLFEETKRIKRIITSDILSGIRNSIPEEWLTDNTISRIDDMFKIIEMRMNRIDDIACMIANERRNETWKGN